MKGSLGGRVLLKKVNVLSMRTGEIRYFHDILIEDGTILSIERDLECQGALTMDCSGKYAMPGLFDAHVHIDTSEMCDLFIANGVTSVRNLTGTPMLMEYDREIKKGRKVGPSIYSSGPIYDGAGSSRYKVINSCRDAEDAVAETIEGGYRWIKTYPEIEPNAYRHLLRIAARRGIKVCGHMAKHLDAKELSDLGYCCCEHVSSMPSHPGDIEYMAKAGMWLCPTHLVCTTLVDYVWGEKKLSDIPHYRYLPKRNRKQWDKANEEASARYRKMNLKPDLSGIFRPVQRFMAFSDKVITGTDTMYPSLMAGFSLHDELEKMVSVYGMTPYQALRSATTQTALHIGVEDKKGTLAAGLDADILILTENPLEDINNTRAIHAVMQGRRVYDREALDNLLKGVENLPDDKIEVLRPD